MKVNAHSVPVLLAAIGGALSSVELMKVLPDMGAKQMAGAIRNLRNNGLISGDVDGFKVLAAGRKFAAQAPAGEATGETAVSVQPIRTTAENGERTHNKRTKIAKALTLFKRHGGDQEGRRQFVIGKFQSQLDMTAGAASTYFQLCRKELGLAGADA